MTEIESLITLSRRYCIENYSFWMEKYSKERNTCDFAYTYSDNEYDIFPRYQTLTAILQGVETQVEKSFIFYDSCKEDLKILGLISESLFTTGKKNKIQENAIQDERNKFIGFIDKVTLNDLINIEKLPHRRKLDKNEANFIRQLLENHWGYNGGYWEPLGNCCSNETVFLMKENISHKDYENIIQFIEKNSEKRIYEITEDEVDYEIEIDSFDPDCYETIFTDNTYKWVIYGSHESTIAFGGDRLVNFIKQLFSDRKDIINKFSQKW